jgi:toxin-antitoxin system PIN domain toxin
MKILLDTNILVYAYNEDSVHHKVAKRFLDKVFAGEIKACISQQVLYEFFSVITNAKKVESPLPLEVAADLCVSLWEGSELEKIALTDFVPQKAFALAKSHKLRNGKVFDCVLAASAEANGVTTIFTENIKDFAKFDFLEAVNPFAEK